MKQSTRSKPVYAKSTERSGFRSIRGYSKDKGTGLSLKTEGLDMSIYSEHLAQQLILLTHRKVISPEVCFLGNTETKDEKDCRLRDSKL